MFNNPFHNIAADTKNEREQLDRVLRITAPHERLALGCLALVVAAFMAWLLFGSVVRSVTVDGVLIVPGERQAAVAAEPGQLLEYLVAPGDRVRAGQPVARQSVPELDRETAALRERVNLLRSQLGQAGGTPSALRPLLDSARSALLQMEARRSARQTIVSRRAGEVMALLSDAGAYLPAGAAVAQIRAGASRPVEAVLRVDRELARRLQPGMAASVDIALRGGETRRLRGTVARIAPGPLPDWLARLPPAVPHASHRVDIVLDPAPGPGAADGTPCRLRIELGSYAPVALIGSRRS